MGVERAEIGTSIGTYVLERKLGSGGMAEVYLARRSGPRGFSKRVAIKRILPELSEDSQLIQMFCDEARIAATLSHPNIAQVIEFGEHEGEFFIVMEYVDGVSCSAMLRTASQRGQAFPVDAALYVAREVLHALAFAHEATDDAGRALGVVHRDVSPSNVLVSRIGTVKLIDFGIMRSLLTERPTCPGELKGKLRYMSPEQILGAQVDARSDLFAAGILLTEMLAGRALFSGKSDLDILTRISRGELGLVREGGVPKDLADVLERALAHRPPDRFQTARDFSRAVEDVAAKRGLRLDDASIVPFVHSLDLLPSASGTRPAVNVNKSARVATVPEHPALRSQKKPPALPNRTRPGAKAEPSMPPLMRPIVREDGSALPPAEQRSSGTYRVRTRSGQIVGPLPRSEMLALLATGRLSAKSNVSLKADTFIAAGSVPALSALASHPAYRFREDDASSPQTLVRLDTAAVPTALYRLALGKRTGLLVAVDGKRRKRVFFENGDPVFIASTDRDELLGRRLVAAGIVTDKAIELALGRQPPLRLGEALVTVGALGAAQLVRELAQQLEERLANLGAWRTGELRFFADVRLEQAYHLRTREPTLPVLTELVRGQYAPGDIASLLRPMTKETLSATSSFGHVVPLLGLHPNERAVLALATRSMTVRDVVTRATEGGVAMADALRAVFIGLGSGCLAAPSWPPKSG